MTKYIKLDEVEVSISSKGKAYEFAFLDESCGWMEFPIEKVSPQSLRELADILEKGVSPDDPRLYDTSEA